MIDASGVIVARHSGDRVQGAANKIANVMAITIAMTTFISVPLGVPPLVTHSVLRHTVYK